MPKVLVFGTFDILHPGHLSFFKQAKKFGDQLIVVVSRDMNAQKAKGRKPLLTEQARLEMVKALRIVDQAVLGDRNYRYEKTIARFRPQAICLGYDQKETPEAIGRTLAPYHLRPKIYRLRSYKPKTYKSSKLKSTSH